MGQIQSSIIKSKIGPILFILFSFYSTFYDDEWDCTKNLYFSAFGSAAANGGNIDDKTAQQLMEEEAAAMEKFRAGASASNPFAAAPAPGAEETPNILDLFGVSADGGAAAAPAPAGATSDDLLQLSGNPFANMLNGMILILCGSLLKEWFYSAAGGPPTSAPMFQATTAPGKVYCLLR